MANDETSVSKEVSSACYCIVQKSNLLKVVFSGREDPPPVTAPIQEEEQRIQQQIDEALACPCVEDLRSGPCGKTFVAAFSCFLRHQAIHKV